MAQTRVRQTPRSPGDAVPLPVGGLVRYRDRLPWWVIPALASCLFVGLGGAALGATALVTSPAKVAGPVGPRGARGAQGPRGLTGPQGPAGPLGPVGPKGATGPAGPQGSKGATGAQGLPGPAGPKGTAGPPGPTGATGAAGAPGAAGRTGIGTIASAGITKPPADLSAPDAPVGTTLTGTASCPAGQVLMSGGGEVSAPGIAENHVAIRSSYPLNSSTWQVVAVVNNPLGSGVRMTLQPFAVCGTR